MVPAHSVILTPIVALTLVGFGLFEILGPQEFDDVNVYFARIFPLLGAWERLRLSRVLESRLQAEGLSHRYIRLAGVFTVAMGGATFIPTIPFTLPYAAACLAMAVAVSAAYLHIHRATQRRAAPLVRRSGLRFVSPRVIAFPIATLAATAVVGTVPQLRLAAMSVAIAMGVLLWIAWRVSVAPALLLGDDPQLEHDVDDEVRRRRVSGLVVFAALPGFMLFTLTHTQLGHEPYATLLFLVVVGTFVSANLANRSTASVALRFT